jgi:hypothetical protein
MPCAVSHSAAEGIVKPELDGANCICARPFDFLSNGRRNAASGLDRRGGWPLRVRESALVRIHGATHSLKA